MKTISTSHLVNAPLERTFEAFTDLRRAPEIVDSIQSLEVLGDGPIGPGTRFRETRIVFKKEATEEMEITAFERPTFYEVSAESCGAQFRTRFRFQPEGDGTRVEVEFGSRPVTFLAKLFTPLAGMMLKACAKQFQADVQAMTRVAEENGQG